MEIPQEDRKCPFCWGKFGLELVWEEEELSDSFSLSEDEEGEVKLADVCVWPMANDEQAWEEILATTMNGDMETLHPIDSETNPQSELDDDDSESDDEFLGPYKLTKGHEHMIRQPRKETGPEPEEKKVAKKHHAVQQPCGHLFGHMCLVKMLKSGEKLCPKRRKDILVNEEEKD